MDDGVPRAPERAGEAGRGERTGVAPLGLVDTVGTLMRSWRLIAGAALVAGAVALTVVVLAVPRRWESATTVVIVPPKFSSELKPATLTLLGYQKLLESGSVIAETHRRLREQGMLRRDEPLRLGIEIDSRIFVSRKSEETSLSPMVQAVAYGATGEQAAAIANTWTQVFLEKTRELSLGATSPMIDFVDARFGEAGKSLGTLEDQRLALVARFSTRHDAAADRWDRETTARQARGDAAVASYRAESSRLLDEYASEHGLETRRAQLAAARQSLTELGAESGRVAAVRAQKVLELDAARRQLAAAPPLVAVRKAMSDDAVWQTAAQQAGKPADWATLTGRTLVTEEVNPLYTELASTAARLGMETDALKPRAEQLAALAAELVRSIDEQQRALVKDEAGLTALRAERDAGAAALVQSNATDLGILARARSRELAAIKGEWDTELNRVDRTLVAVRDLFTSLAKAHNQAVLARTESGIEDVRLASPAVAPLAAEPRGAVLKGALAAVLGALFAMVFVVAREARSPVRRPT